MVEIPSLDGISSFKKYRLNCYYISGQKPNFECFKWRTEVIQVGLLFPSAVIPLYTNPQVANFQSCKHAFYQPQSVSSVAQLCPTLQPHGLQHTRLPCPLPTSGACSKSWPSHPLLSPSLPAVSLSQHQGLFQGVKHEWNHSFPSISYCWWSFSSTVSLLQSVTRLTCPLNASPCMPATVM